MFVLAFAIGALCFRALDLPDVSIIFGMAVMPLTYYPILKVAADTNAMKKACQQPAGYMGGNRFPGFDYDCGRRGDSAHDRHALGTTVERPLLQQA